MAACEPMNFQGITPAVFQSISRQLAAKGFALSGPKGVVNGPFGIVVEYEWNEQSQTLTLQVVDKSFFVTCTQIRDQLSEALKNFV